MLTGAAGACAPVYVCGEVTATLGAEDTVWGLLNVLLERTRYDPGNLGYEIFRDAGD
ncbi:putative quinol monooxygenase, partial [Mycobacteroides abscessus]